MNLEQRIVVAYKVPRISALIIKDIQDIKKFISVVSKFEKNQEPIFFKEALNLLISLCNIFEFELLKKIIFDLTDKKLHTILCPLISNYESRSCRGSKKL